MDEREAQRQRERIDRFNLLSIRLKERERALRALRQISGNMSEVRTVGAVILQLDAPLEHADRGHDGRRVIDFPGVRDVDVRDALLPFVEKEVERLRQEIDAL